MKIKSLTLTNWRNFLKRKIEFNSTIVLVGDNGLGKTNILEAIYFLSTTKSFRSKNNLQLINWEKDFCRVEGEVKTAENPSIKIELAVNKNPQIKFQKRGKVNGAEKKLIDILGTLKVVLFSPESIDMIYGSPALRRKYLDSVLIVTDHRYAKSIIDFNQVLRQRNKLLALIAANQAKGDELDFWDQELAREGSQIILRRISLIKFYNQLLAKAYQEISDNPKDVLRLKYLNSVVRENFGANIKTIEQNYLNLLRQKRSTEIAQQSTLTGPQRDEILFVLNDRSVSTFGSRGELRSVMLATKLVEMEYLAQKSEGEKPILLLDDVFSELDEDRRHKLALAVKSTQAIITTTDLSHLEPSLQKKAKIIKLS